jgi:hypothetical protein
MITESAPKRGEGSYGVCLYPFAKGGGIQASETVFK